VPVESRRAGSQLPAQPHHRKTFQAFGIDELDGGGDNLVPSQGLLFAAPTADYQSDAEAFVTWLSRSAVLAHDPDGAPPIRSADPGDDYLLALAADQRAVLVSGDGHLLALAADLPIYSPASLLSLVAG
jgi:hypothetical protein